MKRKKVKTPMLVSAAEMSHAHPETFFLPDPDEIESIQAGSIVKVSNNFDRFWVEVLERNDNILIGRVDNHLFSNEPKFNDLIQFCTDNIYEVM